MRDVLFLAVVLAFFALTVAYVRGADRLVGGDEADGPTSAPETERQLAEGHR